MQARLPAIERWRRSQLNPGWCIFQRKFSVASSDKDIGTIFQDLKHIFHLSFSCYISLSSYIQPAWKTVIF